MRTCIKILLIILTPLILVPANGTEIKALPDKQTFIPRLKQLHQSKLRDLIPTSSLSEDGFYARIANTDVAILMLPFKTKEEDVYSLSLILALINVKTEKIVQSYFHKNITESDAVYIADFRLDVVTFRGVSKDVVFAVYIDTLGSSRPNPMASTYLYLYAVQNKQVSLLLNGFEVMDSGGENNAAGVGYNNQHTLTYMPSQQSEDYPVLKFQSANSHTKFNVHENLDKTTKTKGKSVELIYINGSYININLKDLEKRAKSSGSYPKDFYRDLIKTKPITRENVRIYNDIAYYLEQNDHNEEAVFILNEILKQFDERMVAYLNLADAYWKLDKKDDAYVNYWQYKNLMHKNNKQSKIPSKVNDRLSAYKSRFEKLFVGKWKNKECGYIVNIEKHDETLMYTLQTNRRKLQGELYIGMDVREIYIDFMGIEWAEDLGGPLPMEDPLPPKKAQKLPIGIEALFDKEQEEFVIQNNGNASYYYVKLEEGCEKYLYFRRLL